MKFQVDKGALVQILQRVQNVADKKTSMPVLMNTLIRATEDQELHLTATDLEMTVWTKVPAQVQVPGSTTVSAQKFLEVVRELPHDQIKVEAQQNDKVRVTAGRSKTDLSTIRTEEFPDVSEVDREGLVPCDPLALLRGISKVIYSVPLEEDPFSVAGIYWHQTENGMQRFVSSDGHRLTYAEFPEETYKGIAIGNGIIIPRKALLEIHRLLEKETAAVIGLQGTSIVVGTESTTISARLLEADFPEYELIIPKDRPHSMNVDLEAFRASLRRVSILTNPKWRFVRMIITNGSLEMSAGDPEVGNADDVIDIDYEGEDFSVAFNVKYVLDAAKAMEGSHARFEWVDEYHGGVFLGSGDPDCLSLIMPMVVS